MSKNRSGHLTGNIEWGSKGRKEEDALRGRNNSARRAAIEDQLAADVDDIVLIEPDIIFEDDTPWYDQGDGFEDWHADNIDWIDTPWYDQGDGFEDWHADNIDWIDAQFFDEPQ